MAIEWLALLPLIQDPAPPPAAPQPRLELRVSALAELWFEARAAREPLPGLEAAAAAAAELERRLGSALFWGPVEGLLAEAETAAELVELCARLPEELEPRGRPGAAPVPLRELATRLALELAAALPRWREEHWPARGRELEAAAERLRGQLTPQAQAAIFERSAERLAMELPALAIPVVLATRLPEPGAVTHKSRGGATCFVGLAGHEGTLLAEAVLHEALHALDVATAGQPTLFERVRAAAAEAGLDPRDRRVRDAAHTLFFLHAAELVREQVASDHVDYGDARGYYARVGEISALERPLWKRYLAGELDLDGLVAAIAAGLR